MSETVAAGQLRAFIERIERVEEEIHTLNADKSEIYKEARGVGFDVKAIRQCVAARKLDSAEREERNAMFDLYWSALQGSVHVHTRTRENIEQFPHSSAPTSSPETTDESPALDPNPAPGSPSPDHASPTVADGLPSEPSSEAVSRAKNDGVASAIVGQDVSWQGHSEQAVTISDEDVPAFLLKDRPNLRPLCLNPEECAGYGTKTCHRCLTAAGRSEVAA